jgi:hypothetical protein
MKITRPRRHGATAAPWQSAPPHELLDPRTRGAIEECERLRLHLGQMREHMGQLESEDALRAAEAADDAVNMEALRAGRPDDITHAARDQLTADRADAADRVRIAEAALDLARQGFEEARSAYDTAKIRDAAAKADAKVSKLLDDLAAAIDDAARRTELVRWYEHADTFGAAWAGDLRPLPDFLPGTATLGHNALTFRVHPRELVAALRDALVEQPAPVAAG